MTNCKQLPCMTLEIKMVWKFATSSKFPQLVTMGVSPCLFPSEGCWIELNANSLSHPGLMQTVCYKRNLL